MSTTKIISMLMIAIALFGWAFAAAAYAHEAEGWRMSQVDEVDGAGEKSKTDQFKRDERFKEAFNLRREYRASFRDFIWNSIRQIPNFFSVVSFNFQHRLWLVILFACLEGGALFLGYVMGKID